MNNSQCDIGASNYKLKNYKNDVSIHDLYANMQFWFSYPLSETQSYYLLQDCLVALYYQMYFLKQQCNWIRQDTSGDGFGWAFCRYGDGVNNTGCVSWICPEAVKKGKAYAEALKAYIDAKEEKKKKEKELQEKEKQMNNAWQTLIKAEECGSTGSNPSPLQAFLTTDCLKGFTCDTVTSDVGGYQDNLKQLRKDGEKNKKIYSDCYPEFLSHRGHTSKIFGTECAVPMGFSGSFREKKEGGTPGPKDGMIGLGIYTVLYYYAKDDASVSSLYQITRCISSLTRRVPRSTGTLYGFFYGLGLVYKIDNNGCKFLLALNTELRDCPGYCDPNGLMKALMGWIESDHSKKHEETKDQGNYTLGSLYRCSNTAGSPTCGWYLEPLTGSLYKSLATQFCETYVSWIIHLTGVLEAGLRKLLEEFRNINCKEAGCKDKSGQSPCECKDQGCNKGTHGVKSDSGTNPKGCCCDNVVECVGVHGLFYRFGFSYLGPSSLGSKKCSQFYTQLGKVIDGNLFDNLFTQLRKFIYSTRALFGVYIGVYWLAVLVYLLWSMTVNLDLVHIQSHWRSPRSYLVPLQRILADGSRKGFCTLGYFQESGDSLVSLGVSDVYL